MFADSARNIADCAKRLRDHLQDPGDDGGFKRIIDCETRGDELTSAILHRLDTSFVTPFDREDIHALAEEMAGACALMGFIGLDEFSGIAFTVAVVYVVFAVLSVLDRWSRGRR